MPVDGDTWTPLIAVTGRRRSAAGVHSGSPDLDRLQMDVFFTGYAEHVAAAGGAAVYLPLGSEPDTVAARVDGLVLTGGTDVDPARYGADAGAIAMPSDPARDADELALLDAVLGRGRPVLAICRGAQLVNVGRGGTLHRHLPDHAVGRDHPVDLTPGSALARLHGPTTIVNSLHHQSVDRLGRDLVATAHAGDGVVEGVEWPGHDLLGVQWHPEQMPGPQPVFEWLVDAARGLTPR